MARYYAVEAAFTITKGSDDRWEFHTADGRFRGDANPTVPELHRLADPSAAAA